MDCPNLFDAAIAYLQAGLSVLPAHLSEKRPAVVTWKEYQNRLPTEEQLYGWLSPNAVGFSAPPHEAVCLICGAVSGHLEMIDFDAEGELFGAWSDKIGDDMLNRLVIEKTKRDGVHVFYRSAEPVCGNMKLAFKVIHLEESDLTFSEDGTPQKVVYKRGEYKPRKIDGQWVIIPCMIETRGEGGLFLCAPSPGYELLHGDPTTLPVLTEAERDILLQAAWELSDTFCGEASGFRDSPLAATPTPQHVSPHAVGESRPGDDFNRRGELRDVLAGAGWALVKPGANEYWRRPGKASGWSATFNGDVFYVFSSNAPPFDPHRGYSKFQVYAMLEHGCDFAAAAASLRRQGYGGESSQPVSGVANISSIVAKARGETVEAVAGDDDDTPTSMDYQDPGPIPVELLRIPGFVSEVMDYGLSTAPYPNPTLAFCGALALQSLLAARKVRDSGDNRTNLYILGLAHSASGKDWPRKVNVKILHQAGMAACLGERFASGEGIQDALFLNPAMLFQTDEIDGMLQSINKARDGKHEAIMSTLLTMYSSSNSVYLMRQKSGKDKPGEIDQPCLSIFGTAIPNHYYEALSERMLTNGFFARMIILDSGSRGSGQEPRILDIPSRILETSKWWSNYFPEQKKGNLINMHPDPTIIEHTYDASTFLADVRKRVDEKYSEFEAKSDPVGTTVWGRASENVRKLALLYAVSENNKLPKIHRKSVEWACELVMHQITRQLFMAYQHVADGEFDALVKRAERYIRSWHERNGNDSLMTRKELKRRMKVRPKEFDDVMLEIEERGIAVKKNVPGKTRPFSGYRLLYAKDNGQKIDNGHSST